MHAGGKTSMRFAIGANLFGFWIQWVQGRGGVNHCFRGVWFGLGLNFKPKIEGAPGTPVDPVPDVIEFARRLGLDADERQCEVLRSEAKRAILNCTRQWGKSTVSAAKALYRAHTRPGSLILVASPSERQSAEWMRKAGDMLVRMGIERRGDGDNAVSLLLPNGSRIVGLPGTDATSRGFSSAAMVLIDEASRVDDAMFASMLPTLVASNGDLWLMSTPYGKRGFFYEMWEHGGDEWMRMRAPVTECPRISKESVERQRSMMTAAWFAQEYMCTFVDGTSGVFDRDVVEGAIDEDEDPLWS